MIAKFRGITEKKEFVYGYLFEDNGEFYIKNKTGCYLVDKRTASQFTGVLDSNKKEIYGLDWVSGAIKVDGKEYRVDEVVCWENGAWEINGYSFKELSNLKLIIECYPRIRLRWI